MFSLPQSRVTVDRQPIVHGVVQASDEWDHPVFLTHHTLYHYYATEAINTSQGSIT